jgi:DNA-binding response OmpR family regulator
MAAVHLCNRNKQNRTSNLKTIKQMKILICDDDQTITSMIRFKLESENLAELFIAPNGDKAMKLLKEHKFDLLITDIHMPYHNGDEIMKTFQDSTGHQVPVIMMSSDCEEEVKTLAKKQGVLHFMSKPFKMPELVKLVKKVFEKRIPGFQI